MARILVVDDTEDIVVMLAAALTKDGHHVVACTSGRRALQELLGEPFDVVLTDLYMPDTDGFDVLNLIRRRQLVTRAIAMSLHSAPCDLLRAARALGAHATLPKPFSLGELRGAVAAVLDQPAAPSGCL